jgi:N-acyl-D-amino-acid deacylase
MAYNLLVRGAVVVPGDGPARHVDVGVTGDVIVAVARSLSPEYAGEVVEAEGLMLCPGFIDMHAHSALESFRDPRLIPKIAQGFTTELINPDGLAPAPVASTRRADRRTYLQALEGPGGARRRPTAEEMRAMQREIKTARAAGNRQQAALVDGHRDRDRPRRRSAARATAGARVGGAIGDGCGRRPLDALASGMATRAASAIWP